MTILLASLSLLVAVGAALVIFLEKKVGRLQRELQADAAIKAVLFEEKRALTLANQELQAKGAAVQARAQEAELAISQLERYRGIVDVEVESLRLQRVAEQNLELLQHKARDSTLRAEREAAEIRARAQASVETSKVSASAIVAEAQVRAEQIAGNALRALEDVDQLRREAKAIESVIKGYGNDYILPAHSLLDDLAEELGHAEAGEKLKKARERTRKMIKDDSAGNCDYAEVNRRDTAVAFVVDAFNGKVDSILSRVKSTNAGTLQQEIRDAFTLVNKNGAAFRNARIVITYLDSRLEELKWAAAAQLLKEEEREEQRRIKERIREEEKARKEYERAIREAEKEEDTIKKAMERVQKDVEKASEAQRAFYETQLKELADKLLAAEEKNRRALSMAQQTKTGHVYVISNIGSFGEDVFKIGLTRRLEPLDRVRELGDASVPFEFDVHAMIHSEDAPALEHVLHRHFLASQINKVNPRKEFFRASLKTIREELEKLGISASWTMTATAAQYRESLAIDKAIRANPASFQAWRDKQLVIDATMAFEDEALADAS